MTSWVRLWHDMPTDPKFRTIARAAKQPLPSVIAIFTFMLTDASANAVERGRTTASDEDIASGLDLADDDVKAVRAAMQGRVLDGDRLTGWDGRQPKKEDDSAARAKAWREEQKALAETERLRTPTNADERPETDAEPDTKPENIPLAQHLLPAAPRTKQDYDGLQQKLLDAQGVGGFRDERNPGLANLAPIIGLIEAGYDLDRDILATIRAKRKDGIGGWAYYVKAIREAGDVRKSIASIPKPTPPAIDWAGRIQVYRRSGTWTHAWGPKPGERGCEVPPALLQEIAA